MHEILKILFFDILMCKGLKKLLSYDDPSKQKIFGSVDNLWKKNLFFG